MGPTSGNGTAVLECRNVIRNLGAPTKGATWQVKTNKSGVPYVTDGTVKKWCMQVFQEAESSRDEEYPSNPISFDINKFDDETPTTTSQGKDAKKEGPPISSMKGVEGRG